tara:strand:+ start:1190 stop:2338 length:1149 start_codon:yes stop_codon:yes gene_type:complete
MSTTISEVYKQIQNVSPKGFTCSYVSWEDINRGVLNGKLSSLGSNITDVRLYTESGKQLFVVRPENWNERLGQVKTNEFCIIKGNETIGNNLSPITLHNYLSNFGNFAQCHGINTNTSLVEVYEDINIRFQTCFIPLEEEEQFYVELYNYQTGYEGDPKNQILLGTSQGTAIHQNSPGQHRIEHQAVDSAGKVHGYLLKATGSKSPVGFSQKESPEEISRAIAEGTASATVIGVKAMGQRFNAVLLIQIPLKDMMRTRGIFGFKNGGATRGFCSSARVSMGKEVKPSDCENKNPIRDYTSKITATVTLYNAVKGGIPCEEDILAATKDIDNLYKSCNSDTLRGESGFGTSELTDKVVSEIDKYFKKYPYKPPEVQNSSVFPI